YVDPAITIRQLLRHQSGVYNFTDHPSFSPTISNQPNIQYTPAAVLYQFLNPPLFDPGEQFSYSNSNYLLLALVIEEATGNSFYEEVRSRFLDPLGLQSFFLPVLEPLQSPIAHLWLDLNGNGQLVDYHDEFFNWDALHTSTAAAGGYYSTAEDLARWIYHSQSGSLFSPATMQEMHDFVTTNFPGNTVYGLGITRRNYVGFDGYGHGGDISYAASAYYFPDLDVSVSVMDNDGTIISWDHAPIISRLLLAYNWYAANFPVPTTEEQASALSFYPNPIQEELWIAGNRSNCSRLEIFDAQGRRQAAFSAGQIPERLDARRWPAGLYWLRWIEAGQEFQATLVKE
ncbi:MAG: beta-lactamase family protein, partial [Phaeodactylibacter sp.]|nr:beta-lactamase family protein [Phaeodactylibacter sp.]